MDESKQKQCGKCLEFKSLDQFSKKTVKKDGAYSLQTICKECVSVYDKRLYESNRKEIIKRKKRETDIRTFNNRKKFVKYLRKHPCVDCACDDIRVLELDHITDDKIDAVSTMLSQRKWSIIEEEMAKCEVRCSNCHTIKTAERLGSWRVDLALYEDDSLAVLTDFEARKIDQKDRAAILLLDGVALEDVCEQVDISYSTLYKWIDYDDYLRSKLGSDFKRTRKRCINGHYYQIYEAQTKLRKCPICIETANKRREELKKPIYTGDIIETGICRSGGHLINGEEDCYYVGGVPCCTACRDKLSKSYYQRMKEQKCITI